MHCLPLTRIHILKFSTFHAINTAEAIYLLYSSNGVCKKCTSYCLYLNIHFFQMDKENNLIVAMMRMVYILQTDKYTASFTFGITKLYLNSNIINYFD